MHVLSNRVAQVGHTPSRHALRFDEVTAAFVPGKGTAAGFATIGTAAALNHGSRFVRLWTQKENAMIDLPVTMTELPVTLYVYEASEVGLTAQEGVRVDELVLAEGGEFDLERYGDLLEPGAHRLALAPGVYHFRLSGDAELQVDPSAVIVVTSATSAGKDDWPDPPRKLVPDPPSPFEFVAATQAWAEHLGVFLGEGEATDAPTPRLRVTATAER